MITILVINDCQCLIYEEEYDTDNANEALERFMKENVSIAVGDMIQVR